MFPVCFIHQPTTTVIVLSNVFISSENPLYRKNFTFRRTDTKHNSTQNFLLQYFKNTKVGGEQKIH